VRKTLQQSTCAWIFVLMLAFVQGSVFADDEESVTPAPMTGLLEFHTADRPPESPVAAPLSPQIDFRSHTWGSFYRDVRHGDHGIEIRGGLSTYAEPYYLQDSLQTGNFSTTVTYRYHGLFKGIVRPVGRFTTGARQSWGAMGGPAHLGYSPGMTAYMVSEVGIEIVYRGVGIGVTAAHMWAQDTNFYMQDDKYTGGPFAPPSGQESLKDFFANVYLILE
jgi:hypothetical protein